MGRPIVYQPEDVLKALSEYIDNTEEPLIQEFCLQYGISRSNFYYMLDDYADLKAMADKCITKQEIYILRNAQKINPTFAIFRLKQPTFGYKDRQEIDNSITVKEDKLSAILETLKDEDK